MLRRTRSLLIVGLAAAILTHGAAAVSAQPVDDPFFGYEGTVPLQSYAPGSVLDVRTVPYHLLNVATPLEAVQILYRSTDAQGRASANVTSVLRPPNAHPDKVVSYQSAYDSLNPDDGPSRAIAGNTPLLSLTPSGRNVGVGGAAASGEGAVIAPFLALGYTVVLADTQGPTADFAAGPEYGMMTLDSLRAAQQVPGSGVTDTSRIGLLGYSGGAIATMPFRWSKAVCKLSRTPTGCMLSSAERNCRWDRSTAACGCSQTMAVDELRVLDAEHHVGPSNRLINSETWSYPRGGSVWRTICSPATAVEQRAWPSLV